MNYLLHVQKEILNVVALLATHAQTQVHPAGTLIGSQWPRDLVEEDEAETIIGSISIEGPDEVGGQQHKDGETIGLETGQSTAETSGPLDEELIKN